MEELYRGKVCLRIKMRLDFLEKEEISYKQKYVSDFIPVVGMKVSLIKNLLMVKVESVVWENGITYVYLQDVVTHDASYGFVRKYFSDWDNYTEENSHFL